MKYYSGSRIRNGYLEFSFSLTGTIRKQNSHSKSRLCIKKTSRCFASDNLSYLSNSINNSKTTKIILSCTWTIL
jgi:hypothetical protein